MAICAAELEVELQLRRSVLDDLKDDRDRWRDMAESAQRPLTLQRVPVAAPAPIPEPMDPDRGENGPVTSLSELRQRVERRRTG